MRKGNLKEMEAERIKNGISSDVKCTYNILINYWMPYIILFLIVLPSVSTSPNNLTPSNTLVMKIDVKNISGYDQDTGYYLAGYSLTLNLLSNPTLISDDASNIGGYVDNSLNGVDFSNIYEMTVVKEKIADSEIVDYVSYKYFGELIFPIVYNITEHGRYIFRLSRISDASTVSETSFYYDFNYITDAALDTVLGNATLDAYSDNVGAYIDDAFYETINTTGTSDGVANITNHSQEQTEGLAEGANYTVDDSTDTGNSIGQADMKNDSAGAGKKKPITQENITSENLTIMDKCSHVFAAIDKYNYSLGEPVYISFSNIFGNLVKTELTILAGESKYLLVGEIEDASFLPQEIGVHEIILTCDGNEIFSERFTVRENTDIIEKYISEIGPDGEIYANDTYEHASVKNNISLNNISLHEKIYGKSKSKNVVIRDSNGRNIAVSAKAYGITNIRNASKHILDYTTTENHTRNNTRNNTYDISNEIMDVNSDILKSYTESPIEPNVEHNAETTVDLGTESGIELNTEPYIESNAESSIELDIYPNINSDIGTATESDLELEMESAKLLDIDLSDIEGLSALGGSNMLLNDLVYDQDSEIDIFIEEVPRQDIDFQGNVVVSFAMDLSNLNFTNGTFTKKAVGKELWKCATWNYSERICQGSWVKVSDIYPNRTYSIEISPQDPGYIETGVATVNTMKSLYYPDETVEIIMVVLDTHGYLVPDANVSLKIISPDNLSTEMSSDHGTIVSVYKGIYKSEFSNTALIGDYTIIVQAEGRDTNSTMVSWFRVSDIHTFEILREIPFTIDPNNGPFISTISLSTNIHVSTFDYTEVLPSVFNITDSSGGTVYSDGINKYIRWYNLTNNSRITYSAQTPLETPNVYEIGRGFIDYVYSSEDVMEDDAMDVFTNMTYNISNQTSLNHTSSNNTSSNGSSSNYTFYEARPWFLAIDPVYTGRFFMFWDGSPSSVPTGWTCVSCNSGDPFYNRFILGNSTYGVQGGSASHNHTVNYVSETRSTANVTRGMNNGATRASASHTHNGITATNTGTAPNYPAFRQLLVIAYNDDRVPSIIPAGAIGIFNSSSLPSNWTSYNAANNYFILANATSNTTGGSNTHNHTLTITTSSSTGSLQRRTGGTQVNVASDGHTHTGSGTTASGSNVPPYISVVLGKATSNTTIPYGQNFIGMFNDSVGDGWTNMSQPGQPFYGRMLFVNSSYSATGGSNVSIHSNLAVSVSATGDIGTTSSTAEQSYAAQTHTHAVTVSFTNATDLPPYIGVIFGYANNSILYPPIINRTECYRQGSGWVVNCTTLGYNSVLTAVRTDCDSDNPGGNISNVSFVLRNIDQGILYFNNTITTMTGEYWQYNLTTNLSMLKSGRHTLTVTCRENPETSEDINWTVSWGNLSVQLISPSANTNVTQNRFFNFTSRVTCINGECGDVNATLDPISNFYAYSGSITDIDGNDEEGGSYSSTLTNDATYYAMGEDDPGAFGSESANSQMLLNFNISSIGMGINFINNLNLSLTYCHSGEDSYAAVDCNGDDPVEKTISTDQDVWIYNFSSSSWLDIGNLNTANGENEVTSIFSAPGSYSDLVSSNGIVTFRTEIVSAAGGAGTDAWLAVDYAALAVDYVGKDGAISMVAGTIPFYTTTANPMLPANRSCLYNMTAGDICDISWEVNATGPINFTGTFFVIYDSINFSSFVSERNTSRINITIRDSVPPTINSVQCYRQGTGWTSCTNILFNSNLTDIRANCTAAPGSSIVNVSFLLYNRDYDKTYFNVTTGTTLSGYWYYNITDILLQDSGLMELNITCTDDIDASIKQAINWTIPWGNISVKLISPNTSMNVTQNRFFNFSVNLSCIGGQCGDVSIVLDPTSSWWDGRWVYRRLLNITHTNTQILQKNYSIRFILNTTGSNFLPNGNDVRVVYYNGSAWTELDRVNETGFNSTSTEIWFKLQSNISAGGYDDNYYVYYGNRFASIPPANRSRVYLWFDDFNRSDKADITTESSYAESGNAGWAISNNRLYHTGGTSDPSKLRVVALGTPVDDVDMKIRINVTSWAGGSDSYRFGLSQDMDDAGGAGRGYNGLLRNSLTQSAFLNDMVSWGTTGAGTSSVTLNNWYYMRYQSINNTNPTARFKTWPVTVAEPPNWNLTGNYGTNNRGKGYVGIMGALVATVQVYIDDLQIRYILPNEPNTVVGVEEQGGKGDIPVGSGTPFYTINANPVLPSNDSCLSDLNSGESCIISWTVNATGNVNTTWNFFTYAYFINYSALQPNFSSIVNISILGNIAPIVRSAVVTPDEPVYYEDINCTFNITDQNIGDSLSATINWYRDGVFIDSDWMAVTEGQRYTSTLDSDYLTAGDIWRCGVVPYDGQDYGLEVFSNNVTILASVPPIVNRLECLRNGAVWVSCSNILYGNTLSKVRANCTSRLSYPVSVSFNLTNIDDSYMFFTGDTTDNSSGYWVFDNSDFVVSDSGIFNLSAVCTDANGTSRGNYTNWTVPWGILNVSLINPVSSINVTQYKFFNFTSKITCLGGECGYINATIDPVNWWNSSWNYRRTINLTERANRNLTDYQFNVTIDTQSLINAGKMNSNCSDIRFTTNGTPSVLLNYWIETGCNSTSTLIWVKYNLSASGFNTIYLYYGNPDAVNMSNAKNTMFLYEDMNNTPDGSIIGDAEYVDGNTGVRMTIAANNLLGYLYYVANPGPGFYGRYETWAGGGSGADSTWIGIYDTSVSSTREDIVYGGYHFTVDEYQDRIAFTKSTVDNGASIAQWGSTTLDNSAWHIYETYFYHNGTSANALIYYDGVLRVNGTDNSPQNTTGQYFLFGARTGGSTNEHRIRGINVRKYVRPEPVVGVESEISQFKGVIPMNSGTPFYTITANPMLPANNSCLANMKSGDSCNTTWVINATGILYVPWEFFVTYSSLNYSGRVIDNITRRVNITIIGNMVPVVSSVNLTPNYPLPTEDLNCSFIVSDTNAADILTANVTWYRNNAYYSSSTVSLTNSVLRSVILGSGNVTLGETWKCGVRPYDQQVYGLEVNSSNQTIVNSKPPTINKLECLINNSVWTNCSRLGFYSNFSGVRVNCTTAYKPISNVTFNFSNTPDNTLFFSTVVTSNTSVYWTYYQNITINDSGEFIVGAACTNNESASDFETDIWNVPWGNIVITLIDPSSDGYVEYERFFNFTAQMRCSGGECGNVTAILDPIDIPESEHAVLESEQSVYDSAMSGKTYMPFKVIVESSGYNEELVKQYSYYQNKRVLPEEYLGNHSAEYTYPGDYSEENSADYSEQYSGENSEKYSRDYSRDNSDEYYTGYFKATKSSGNPSYPDGLITVNTDKSHYILGEKANILFVLLDGKGNFYAPDDIEYINISVYMDSDNYLIRRELSGTVRELHNGIYQMETEALIEPGRYTVEISAPVSDSETKSIHASNTFIVHGVLEYYISRQSPLAVNPWDGNDGKFTTRITLKENDVLTDRRIIHKDIRFTEVVPDSLKIVDARGGMVWKKTTDKANYTYITWNNVNSMYDGEYFVEYVALPQKISPDIYELQSFVSMDGSIFGEMRPWMIAVDPTNYYSAYAGSYAMTTTSGASASGGSYSNTISQDCSGGTCTQSNSYVTGITGFGGSGATCTMNVTLLFNISDIKTIYLNNMLARWGGCWHGDSNLANPRCDGVNTPKFTTGTGGGTFDMWINQSGTFVKLDCIDNFNNECGSGNEINLGTSNDPPSWGNANDYHSFIFDKSVFNDTYVNNGIVALRWRTWGVGVCGAGAGTNILLALDYANLSINWSYLIKNGTIISMVPGTEPFYTITANPHYPANSSCLMNMKSGNACNITWQVNATGGINTSHLFYVIGNATTYQDYVPQNLSRNITLTIRDTSKVPPTVTLNSPSNNYATQNTDITFNCSATDNSGLVNMTLYGNFWGDFMDEETKIIRGTSNITTFEVTLVEGNYTWNCLAEDIDGNTRFAVSNRTVVIDNTDPSIYLNYPAYDDNITSRTVNLNFTVTDNLDSSMMCNISYDSNATYFTGISANNGSITSRTIYNVTNGDHYWNVTCIDDAGNLNFSETRKFTLLSTPPIVILQTIDGYMTNSSTVELFYFADDGGTIENAHLYINGVYNQSDFAVETGNSNSFIVYNLSEGGYLWTVNATNDGGLSTQPSPRTFYVDFTPPSVNISLPVEWYNSSSSTVTFNFTATDNIDPTTGCKITINGVDVLTGINANNNSMTSRNVVNIQNGLNYWNVTCVDDAGNSNTSATRILNVSSVPTVALNNPANNTFQKLQNITLYYTPSGSNNMSNCTLILNGAVNQTNSTIFLGVQNSFRLTNLSENSYTWSVNCTDITGYTGSSSARIFYIDMTSPVILLNRPIGGESVYGSTTTFNYTVTDNLDPSVTCSLMIDGVVNRTGIVSYTNNDTLVNIAVAEGDHTWNVTCLDHALNSNSSNTESFTVIGAPTVTLSYPGPNAYLNYSTNINFTYIPSSGNALINATLYINGILNQTINNPSNGVENYFYVNFSVDRKYNWSVVIFDSLGLNGTSITQNFTIDTNPPNVIINTPTEGQTVSRNNVTFRFNVTDNLANPLYCNITLSGSVEWPDVSISNGTVTRYKILYDGVYNWSVSCVDNAGNRNSYYLINFTVEAPPNITLNSPTPNYRTTLQNITFNYTPWDDIGLDICYLVINDADIQNYTSVVRNIPNYFNITDAAEGDYNWTVRCIDSAPDSNINYPPVRNFTIDLTPPSINMLYPGIDESINNNTVRFNWTATDYPVNITCMLFIDDSYNQTLTQLSGTYFTPSVTNFTAGVHNWSLNCSDDLNNSVLSTTRNFTINNADLYLDTNRIYFNNTNPNENQTINITANVTNIGGVPATGVLVNFYDGDPGLGGIFIGNATGNVNVNASVLFSALWNITTGYHVIYVSVDPYDTISELSEINNNATRNISLLRAIILSPENNSGFSNPNVSVTFKLDDFTGGELNYTIYVDNILNGQNGTVVDGVDTSINISLTEGTHTIKIGALDSLGRRKNSTAIFVTVDYTPPNSTILTLNNTWYNYSTPIINITSRDNTDTNINYTIYANGGFNTYGNISNGTTLLITLDTLSDGLYELVMEAFDDFNNSANSTPKIIYVDTISPNISLNYPGDGDSFISRSVLLNYTPGDNLANYLLCNITIDGNIVAGQNITIGNSGNHTINNLIEGTHYWNVTCRDQASNSNASNTYSFNVYAPPLITLLSPINNNWSNAQNNTFYFNVSDETGLENCSLLLNGAVAGTKINSELVLNGTNNITVNEMASGNYTWAIECYDNTSYHAYNITANRTFYVDLFAPGPYIETPEGSWFNTSTPLIDFNITDNMDLSIDYTFYVNGTPNVTGSVGNSSSISVNLVNLQNGTYIIILEGRDNAGNSQNSTPTTIYIDTEKPSVVLTNPSNDTNVTTSNVDLNFTPSDNIAEYLICNVTLDGSVTASDLNITSGQNQNVSVSELSGGYHYWNVTCIDRASNRNTSQTYRFYVVMPDLYINGSMIYFNNYAPVENETIDIIAEITNLGLSVAQNFTVEIRVNGYTGPLLYNSTLTLDINESVNLTTNYTLGLNDTFFYVLVDVPLVTNGTVRESNELNNNASRSVHVGFWQFVVGNTYDRLTMTDISNQTIYDWLVSNASGSKLFVADIDSSINWRSLRALGINSSNQSSPTDFYTLDVALGSATYSDSVNRTYTSGGVPLEMTNYTIFTKSVEYIPVVNSTNNSNFKTGILWDYGDGGARYLGTQDVLFVSPINKNTLGYNATVDYEIRIPATLRSYKAGQNMVVFYAEIN